MGAKARMMERADPYERTRAHLAGSPFNRIRYVHETDSTNEDAAAMLGSPDAAGMTIVAEHQSHGKGRKGRVWIATAGSALLFTSILPEMVDADGLWSVPFWASLAVRGALAECRVDAALQWPNDLLLGGLKLAGILGASRVSGHRAWVACGVGINVYRTPDADALIEPPPAFCSDVAEVDRAELLESILEAFAASLPSLNDPGTTARVWERQAGLPTPYRIQHDDDAAPFEADAVALDGDGSLIVERNGARERISLADARVIR